MNQGIYYLAGPFQGTPLQEKERTDSYAKLTAEFLTQGISVFSPIVYTTTILEILNFSSTEERRETMMPFLYEFLKVSKGMIVVTMEGWQRSWGLRQELLYCKQHLIPVFQIEPHHAPGDLPQIFSYPLDQGQLEELLKAA